MRLFLNNKFAPGALALVVGMFLLMFGIMADVERLIRYGVVCSIGAGLLLGVAAYLHRQGWG